MSWRRRGNKRRGPLSTRYCRRWDGLSLGARSHGTRREGWIRETGHEAFVRQGLRITAASNHSLQFNDGRVIHWKDGFKAMRLKGIRHSLPNSLKVTRGRVRRV